MNIKKNASSLNLFDLHSKSVLREVLPGFTVGIRYLIYTRHRLDDRDRKKTTDLEDNALLKENEKKELIFTCKKREWLLSRRTA